MKKIISVFLAVIMLLSAFAVITFAEENCEHTTTNGKCNNCNAFIIEEGATLSLSINLAGYNIFDTEWKLSKGNATIADSGSDILIMMGSYYQETKEWVIIEGITVGSDTLTLYSNGSIYTSAEITVIPHQTHIPKVIEGTATCTSPGLSAGEVCEYCGEVLVEQTEVEAFGHNEVIVPGYAATCYETGLTDGVKCSVCNEIFTAQEEIPADHDYVDSGWPATCTESGWIDYFCLNCGDYYYEGIEPTGHTYDSGNVTTAATCTSAGVKTYTCKTCRATKTEAIAKLGHTEKTVKGYAASYTKTGLTEGKKCSVCGEILVAQEVIPMLINPNLTVKDNTITVKDKMVEIAPKMNVTAFMASTETDNIKIVDKDGKVLTGDKFIGTGSKVQVLDADGNVLSEYVVVTNADVNGDGVITPTDARLALRAAARLDTLTGVYKNAADIDGNRSLTPSDARRILRKAAGLEK